MWHICHPDTCPLIQCHIYLATKSYHVKDKFIITSYYLNVKILCMLEDKMGLKLGVQISENMKSWTETYFEKYHKLY